MAGGVAGSIALDLIISAQNNTQAVFMEVGTAIAQLASGNVLGALTAGLAAVSTAFVGAAKDAGDFQQQMELTVTGAGADQRQLAAMSAAVLQMSVDTGTSAKQLAEGLYMINAAGYQGAAGLQVLKASAEGAKAENADLGIVAKDVTGILHDYHLPAEDAVAATNGLVAAVSVGKMHMQDFALSIGTVLPKAAELGVKFPEVAAAVAMMTNSNTTARQAAQNLAFALKSLGAPSGIAIKAMESIGLSAQQVKDMLGTQGLAATLQMIEQHIGKTFPANSYQATEALKEITGGAAGWNVALELGGSNMKDFEKQIKFVTDAMMKGGNAVENWDIIQGEFNFKVSQAQDALQAMMITVGNQLLPILGKMVDWVTQAVIHFTAWEAQTHFVENGLNAIVTAITWLTNGIGTVIDVITQLWTLIQPAFDGMTKSAWTWGHNMMVGFGNGIVSVINDIIAIVQNVAQEIANYLGFASPAKKGPGAELASWGPGLVGGFVEGVANSLPLVANAVAQIAGQFSALGSISTLPTGTPQVSTMIDQLTGDTRKTTVTPNMTRLSTVMSSTAAAGSTMTSSISNGVAGGAGKVATATTALSKSLTDICPKATSASKCAADAMTSGLASKIKSQSPAAQAAAAAHATAVAAAAAKSQDSANARAAQLNADWQKAISESSTQAVQDLVNKSRAEFAKGNIAMAQFYARQALQLAAAQHAEAVKAAAAAAKAGPAPVAGVMGAPGQYPGADALAQNPALAAINDAKKAVTQLNPITSQIKNIWGDVLKFFQQVGVGMSKVGAQIQAAFKAMLPGLQDIWRVVQTQLVPALKELWTAIQPGVALIGQIAGGLVVGGVAFAKWATSASTLKPIWDFLVVTTKIIISILATLISTIADALAPVFKQLSDTFKTQLKPAWDDMIKSIQPTIPFWTMLAHAIGGLLVIAIGVLIALIGGLIKGLGGLLAGIIQAIGGIVQIVSGFIQIISGIIAMIYDIFTGNWKQLQKDNDTVWNGIMTVIKGIWNVIVGILKGAWDLVIGTAWGFIQTIIKFFQNLSDTLVGHSIVPEMISKLIAVFKNLWDSIVYIIGQIVKWVVDQFMSFRDKTIAYWNAVQAGITLVLKMIQSIIQTDINFILSWLQKQWTAFQAGVQTAWNAVQTIIQKAGAAISSWLGTWIAGMIASAIQWGTNLMKSFADAITKGIANVTTAVTGVANKIKSFLGIASPAQTGPLSTSDQWMPNFMTMLANGIKINTPKVTFAINGVANQFTLLTTNVNTSVNNINAKIGTLGNNFGTVSNTITSHMTLLDSQVNLSANNINQSMNGIGTNVIRLGKTVGDGYGYIGWIATVTSTSVGQTNIGFAKQLKHTTDDVITTQQDLVTQMQDGWNQMNDGGKAWNDQMNQWWAGVEKTLNEKTKGIHDALFKLGDDIKTMWGNLGTWLTDAGRNFTNWMQGMVQQAQTASQQVAMAVSSVLGHSKPKIGPLKDDDLWGKHMMDNIISGMKSRIPELTSVANQAAGIVSDRFSPSFALSTGSTPTRPMTIYMTIDGKTVGKVVTKYQEGELRVQGVIRST